MQTTWSSFDSMFKSSLDDIRRSCEVVDIEAFAASIISQENRHNEIKAMILASKAEATPEKTIRLPCRIIEFAENPHFVGRRSVLAHMKDVLASKNLQRQASIALAGLGGVGKTQLATQFTWENKDQFEVVLWVQADSVPKLERGFSKLAQSLNLPSARSQGSLRQVVDEAMQWLSSTGM